MPKNPDDAAAFEQQFKAIVSDEYFYTEDIGLTAFDKRVLQLEQNANDDAGSLSDLLEPGIQHLNDEWLYHDDIATVSGRIYVGEASLTSAIPKDWGEQCEDEHGHVYYFVENAQLVSRGIVDGMHGDTTENGVDARIGYGFALSNSPSFMTDFVMYPGEYTQHHYDIPTPQAIDVMLHKSRPELMKVVDQLIIGRDQPVQELPRRMNFLTRRLKADLENDEELREWLSRHVNETLKLDQVWPYMLEVEGEVLAKISKESDWHELEISNKTVIHGRRPRFEFVMREGGTEAILFIETPDADDEWGGIEIGIPVASIVAIRGTKALKSLIERALEAEDRRIIIAGLDNLSTLQVNNELADVTFRTEDQPNHGGDPLQIESMKYLQEQIDAAIKETAPLTRKQYETHEQAAIVSQQLIGLIANRLNDAAIGEYFLRFDGVNALRAASLKEKGEQLVEPGEFYLRVNVEAPFIPLEHGDNFVGKYWGLIGDVDERRHKESDEVVYVATPRMIVEVDAKTTPMLEYNGLIPLIEVEARRRGLIPLDGSVKVSVASLERHIEDREAQRAVYEKYQHTLVADNVRRLFQAMHDDGSDEYKELRRVDLLTSVGEYAETEAKNNSYKITHALEALLVGREIVVSGVMHNAGFPDYGGFTQGVVADVKHFDGNTDEDEYHGVYIVVLDENDEEYRYVKISAIDSFGFHT